MKKILVLLFTLLLLLSACTTKKNEEREKESIDNNSVNRVIDGNDLSGRDYIDLLKNYVVRYKDTNNTTDNADFNAFLDKVFVESMEEDYLNMHYNVIDYAKYGISKPEVSIGELEYSDDPDISDYVALIEELQAFDYDSLSYRQQYDYEVLEYSLLETIASTMYSKYDQLLTGGTDILNNISTNLEEFTFYDAEALDDYMILLQDVDRYIEDVYSLTAKQAENGLYLTDYSIDYQIDYINDYCSKIDDNVLITSFEKRINEIDFIDDAKKEEYIELNEKIVKEEIIPAYQKGIEELSQYYGKATMDSNRLINIDKDYAELCYILNSSNNESIDKIFNDSKELFDDYIAKFNTAIYKVSNINEFYSAYAGEIEPLGKSNEEILEFLAENYALNYPDVGEIKYTVDYLDEASASDSIKAYYYPSPIDDLNKNVIKVNPNSVSEDAIDTYLTIAHEGIPGHLYEHVHFYRNDPHIFRVTQSFIGYTEGYACYSELNALDYLNLSEGTKDIIFLQEFGFYVLEAIIDLGVNYYNWTIDDVVNYLDECGFDSSIAEPIMNDIIDRVGIFTRYGIGCLNLLSLRENTKELLGDNYDEISFNETITKNGPLPLPILKEAVNEYIYGE